MPQKFTKFDISLPKLRPASQNPKPEAPVIIARAKVVRAKKSPVMQVLSFALGAISIVALLQGASYLSSAKKASGEILGAATSAASNLNDAGKNLGQQNFASALQLFQSASGNVKLAQDKLNNYKALTFIAPQANSADHILTGAGELAQAGEKLTTALNFFGSLKISSKGVETADFDSQLTDNKQQLTQTKDLISQASDEFNKAGSVPLDYEGTLDKAKAQVSQLGTILDKLIGLENLYLNIFGSQKTYLLIFQNPDEERATGGFIGTYGVLKTNHGTISELKIDSIYNLDGQIFTEIAAPGPFQPAIARWGIRDSNWFADFPTSASKLLYFFEQGGETADGVISATPKLFEDLLNLVGPIQMDQYGVTLTAQNFQQIVQYKTSVDYDHSLNDPKKMLADFAPLLLDRLTNMPKEQWINFLQILQDNLNSRQVLLYSKDASAQKSIDDLGFSGRILPTDYDYLAIINSNLGGTKTDLEMQQNVNLKSKILSDGSIINTLTINRKNTAVENNKDYMRVMVPIGSQFVSAVGFDDDPMPASVAPKLQTDPDLAAWDVGTEQSNMFIRTESGKAEFAGWLEVAAGQEKTATITYMLPFTVNANTLGQTQSYSLLVQKQSGSIPYNFQGSLSLGNYSTKWTSGGVQRSGSTLNFNSDSNVDDFWGFVVSK